MVPAEKVPEPEQDLQDEPRAFVRWLVRYCNWLQPPTSPGAPARFVSMGAIPFVEQGRRAAETGGDADADAPDPT